MTCYALAGVALSSLDLVSLCETTGAVTVGVETVVDVTGANGI